MDIKTLRLLLKCHDAIWLNALEPIEEFEKFSQEELMKIIVEIEELLEDNDVSYQ